MQRIYSKDLEKNNKQLTIREVSLLNQLIKVLRAKVWDKIIFFNWLDFIDFVYEIIDIEKREINLKKIDNININNEIAFELNLYQAIPNKLEKIEYVLQKWTEIWISNFYFLDSERSLKINLSTNKLERLKKIVIEAVEQSWRNVIPKISFLDKLEFKNLENNTNLFFHTKKTSSKALKNLNLDYEKPINIFVWAEWGFTETEVEIFRKNDFEELYLWERILRTETAWIVSSFFIIQNK